MAKIQVNEKDMSWYYRTRDPGVLTVLTPILANWGPYNPTLVDFNNFRDVYGDPVTAEDLSYPIAYSLAKSGITILGLRINVGGVGSEFDPNEAENGWASYNSNTGLAFAGHESEIPSDPQDIPENDYKTMPLLFEAKYSGTYGNNIKVVCKKVAVKGVVVQGEFTSLTSFLAWFDVKDSATGDPLESLVYEFIDVNSEYYWDVMNRQSQYIEVYPPMAVVEGSITSNIDTAALLAYVTNNTDYYRSTTRQLSGGTDATEYDQQEAPEGLWDNGVFKFDSRIIAKSILVSGLVGSADEIWSTPYAALRDLYTVDFDVAINGGYNYRNLKDPAPSEGDPYEEDNDIDAYFLSLVKARGTAIYLVDSYINESAEDFFSRCGTEIYDNEEDGFVTDIVISAPGAASTEYLKVPGYTGASSYCAAYGPWSYAQLLATGRTRLLPGSYVMLTAWARALTNGVPAYLAPAGVNRASLGEIVLNTIYPVGSAIIDAWQNHEWYNVDAGYKVNPIARLRSYGYVVYGNSTLLKSDAFTGATSMLQSLSTRIVANLIKRRAFDVSLSLQFDQIDDKIFASFNAEMGAFMDELKYGGALYSYKIVANYADLTLDDLNQRTVPIKILVSPNPAAENFIIDLEIHPSGVTFGDDTAENAQLPLQ